MLSLFVWLLVILDNWTYLSQNMISQFSMCHYSYLFHSSHCVIIRIYEHYQKFMLWKWLTLWCNFYNINFLNFLVHWIIYYITLLCTFIVYLCFWNKHFRYFIIILIYKIFILSNDKILLQYHSLLIIIYHH